MDREFEFDDAHLFLRRTFDLDVRLLRWIERKLGGEFPFRLCLQIEVEVATDQVSVRNLAACELVLALLVDVDLDVGRADLERAVARIARRARTLVRRETN